MRHLTIDLKHRRFVSRAIVVTDRPIQSESELDVVVWPSEDGSNTKTIVVQGSSSSQVAPVGLCGYPWAWFAGP